MANHLTVDKSAAHYRFKTLARAFLIALVCLSLVALSSYTAPKAQAEAITLSLTTAFLMLVISVMSTLGVTLTAPSVDDGVDYLTDPFLAFLQGKGYSSISEYLASVGITAVSQLVVPVFGAINIVKNVYDVIAEFCSSFFASEGVTSGGSDVGQVAVSGYYSSAAIMLSSSSSFGYYEPPSWLSYSYSGDVYSITANTTLPAYRPAAITFRIPNPRPATVSVRISTSYSSVSAFVATTNQSSLVSGSDYPRSSLSSSSPTVYANTWTTLSIPYISNAVFLFVGMSNISAGTRVDVSFSEHDPTTPAGFVISPSATVIDPPAVATGQTYSVPASGVDSTTAVETAINTAVAPLTTSGGLTQTGTAAGSAVTEGMEWLYEDTQAIRENTNPHFDFIPSTSGINIGIWHYVVDMFAAVAPAFALFGSFLSALPPIVAVLPFGSLALVFVVALIRRFTS